MKRPARILLRSVGRVAAGFALLLGVHCLYLSFDSSATPGAAATIARPARTPGEVTLLFAGDTAETDLALPVLRERGFDYPFEATGELIRAADLAVVNAEAPITNRGTRFPLYDTYVYRAPPESARALARAGVDVLSLANNHIVDYGEIGVLDTLTHAEAQGMSTVGAGASLAQARRGLIATVGDTRIGFLSYCEDQLIFRYYFKLFARDHRAGAAPLTERLLSEDIARLRPQVDVLVVSFHSGYNYRPPQRSTIAFAKHAIDLGADLVINHHPHIAHPMMMYRDRPIALSLGNFAFGTPGHPDLDYGWLLYAHLAKKRLDRIELTPIAVQNRRVQFRPAPLAGGELDRALERMRAESAERGTTMRLDHGRLLLDVPHS